MPSPNSYATGSVFTITPIWDEPTRRHEVVPGAADAPTNDPSFYVAVVQFEDDGTFTSRSRSQVDAAVATIQKARQASQYGALVVVFIHGWHHNAAWNRTASMPATEKDGDEHFHSFRLVLESLAIRELERQHWRRVVGIYLAWNGNPVHFPFAALSSVPGLTHLTFWDRYPKAKRIGAGGAFQDTLRSIITTTKEQIPASQLEPESPLVLIGHSMGALMLESGLLALLEAADQPLIRQQKTTATRVVQLKSGREPVSLPDLILALNSAADSRIAKRILEALKPHHLKKTADGGDVSFDPPIMMSVTSTGDIDTKLVWRAGQLVFAPWRRTDGHDSALLTHDFVLTCANAICQKKQGPPDFGQNWHCLRKPNPANGASPAIPVDLPARERKSVKDEAVPHSRYTITPRIDTNEPRLMWVFQVGPEVIRDHNDIFESKARSLILALIQISGAVASIAEEWADSFEPEFGEVSCADE